MTEKQRPRFVTHILRICSYVAEFFWLAFVYAGIKLVSLPETGRHSHVGGWVILAAATTVLVATTDHWVKTLQFILGGGILGGIVVTATGHLVNDSRPFPRLVALAITGLLIGSSLVSRTMAARELAGVDRVALVAFVAALVGGIVKNTPTSGAIGLAIGFVCLSSAWAFNRVRNNSSRGSSRTKTYTRM